MKILMMSKSGDGFGIAHRMQLDGHDVRLWVQDKDFDRAMSNILERVPSWRPSASKWADLVVGDMVGMGHHATALDRFEVAHIGFNQIADMLELDRLKQMQLLRRVGIPTPETFDAESPGEAEDFVDLWKDPGFVVKPSGNRPTGQTYVCRDRATYAWALEQFPADHALIVQRIIQGVEISTEGWFNGTDWMHPFNHTYEEKRLFDGGLGPNTGCMGNVVRPVVRAKDKLVAELRKLTPFLKGAAYQGPIDMNAIVNERGVHVLELTARFGYDAIEALDMLLVEPITTVLLSIINGGPSIKTKNLVATAVRVTVPPYPHENTEDIHGVPIRGIPKDFEGYYLTDAVRTREDELQTAGTDGVLMKVVGTGGSVKVATKAAYDRVARLSVLDAQYRSDIGARVDRDEKQLRKWSII